MEKPKSGCSGSEFRTYPPPLSISVGIQTVSLVQPRKKFFCVSEISADPQKRSYEVKGVSCRVKNGQKFLMKIDKKFNIS